MYIFSGTYHDRRARELDDFKIENLKMVCLRVCGRTVR